MGFNIQLTPKQYAFLKRYTNSYAFDSNLENWLKGKKVSQIETIRKVKKYFKTDGIDTLSDKKPEKYKMIQKEMKRLDKRQKVYFKNLYFANQDNALKYLKTFQGKKEYFNITGRGRLNYDKPLSNVKNLMNKIYCPFETKKPFETELGEWIGIEIECIMPSESVGIDAHDYRSCDYDEDGEPIEGTENFNDDGFNEACIESLGNEIKDCKLKYVSVRDDGSLDNESDEFFTVELTVFFKRTDLKPLEKLCTLLNNLGAKVNKSCGLHVHLDCRDIKHNLEHVNKRASRIGNALPVLTQLVPQSRLNNRYCEIGVSRIDGERYFAVNKTAFKKYQTIEIRLHSGTTDFKKISEWALLLFSISRSTELNNEPCVDLDQLLETVQAKDSSIEYFLKRAEKFSNQTTEEAA